MILISNKKSKNINLKGAKLEEVRENEFFITKSKIIYILIGSSNKYHFYVDN